ncbi:MAG: ABC transporter permease [Actinomycetota bacterium]|nr:ABC transporter permease [Actinomycetota bacterium]
MAAGAMAVIVAVGKIAFSVALPLQFASFVVSLAFGAAAMLALGTLVSAVVPNQRLAGLVGSLLFFPMMFLRRPLGPAGPDVARDASRQRLHAAGGHRRRGPGLDGRPLAAARPSSRSGRLHPGIHRGGG